MSRKDLEKQIRELSNELTMATFISRGAISENRELKNELEELRKQNAVLRTTENRLSVTEEELENCEERVARKEAKIKELEKLTAGLQGSLREWEGVRQDMRNWMKQGEALLVGEVTAELPVAGPSVRTLLHTSIVKWSLTALTDTRTPKSISSSHGGGRPECQAERDSDAPDFGGSCIRSVLGCRELTTIQDPATQSASCEEETKAHRGRRRGGYG